MTKRHNILVIITAAVISFATGTYIITNSKTKQYPEIRSRVFPVLNGWGYDILVNDTLFIRQESIPVMAGNTGFPKKEYAEQTARLIINKMKRGEHPAITTFELEKIIPVNTMQHARSRSTQ